MQHAKYITLTLPLLLSGCGGAYLALEMGRNIQEPMTYNEKTVTLDENGREITTFKTTYGNPFLVTGGELTDIVDVVGPLLPVQTRQQATQQPQFQPTVAPSDATLNDR